MVKVVTKLNAETLKSLNKFSIKKILPFLLIFSAVFVLLGICNIPDEDGDFFYGIFLIAVGVLFIPLCLLFTRLNQKNAGKTMPLLAAEPVITVIFNDDKIFIEELKGDFYKGTTEASYSYFYKAHETKTHYFLYISPQQCHVIPKKDIVEGTVEELNLLLFRNLGPRKFVVQKNK